MFHPKERTGLHPLRSQRPYVMAQPGCVPADILQVRRSSSLGPSIKPGKAGVPKGREAKGSRGFSVSMAFRFRECGFEMPMLLSFLAREPRGRLNLGGGLTPHPWMGEWKAFTTTLS